MLTEMHVRIRAERSHASHRALVPLVTGVLIGVSLSTLFLMPPYTSITNVYLQLPSEKENSLGRLSKLDRMLSDLTASRHSGVRRLAEEVMVKPKVYYAIVMSHRHSSEQIKVLRDTWAQDIADRVEFYIPPERKGEQASEQYAHYGETEFDQVNAVELHNLHADFHMDVVSHMCRSKLNLAKWFFMAGDNVYVKTQALEKFLQPYENDLSIGCLGRPASKKSGATSVSGGCNEETGIVLSHSALSELCQKLQACNESKEEAEKGLKLGICMQKLGYECNKNTQGEKYFLLVDSATQGSLIEEVNFDKLDTALTIYPVSDVKMMYTIHQFVVSRLLNATHHEMQKLKWSLDRMNELLPRSHHDHHQATYGHNTKVVSTNDIVSWKLINHNSLMSDEENLPTRDIPEIWSSELETMMNKAVQYLDAWADAKQILYKKIVNAYWRVDPMVGIHYIIDFEANKRDQDGITQPNRHRVTFKRPLNVPEMSSLQPTTSQYVTIAVCMTSEHISKLQEFMRRLEAVLDYDQRVSLLVVQMKSASEKQNPKRTTSVIDPRSILSLYKSKYHLAYFTVIDSPALISRSHSVSILLHQLRPGEILFLADLDLDFDENFINHCRNIPLQGQQAYFPIVFAQNSPSLLALFNHSLLEHSVSSHSGHWLVDSYSTACIYAADLLAASTQQSELKGIPNEVDMQKVFKALLERKYGIIRSPDKHLKQTFTLEKSCSLNFIGLTYDSCDETMETYGTHYLQTQLSELLFDHEGEFANKY